MKKWEIAAIVTGSVIALSGLVCGVLTLYTDFNIKNMFKKKPLTID